MVDASVVCFVEDLATETFVRSLIGRLATEGLASASVSFLSGRGGSGVVKSHFRAYQRAQHEGLLPGGRPDLLIIVSDCDCRPRGDCKHELRGLVDSAVFAEHVVGAPSSHVESWYMADLESFTEIVGARPAEPPRRGTKDAHKRRLEDAIAAGGNPSTNGGAEFAPDLVAAMDWIKAAATEASLGEFVVDLRQALRRVARTGAAVA
jgi:hypothetical protein